MSEQARTLAEQYGGVWGAHPLYHPKDWQYEVGNDDTRASYWDWVLSKIDAQAPSIHIRPPIR